MPNQNAKITCTLEKLAALTDSQLYGNPAYIIEGVEELAEAGSSHVSFLENPRYQTQMKKSAAGAVFVSADIPREEGKNYLVTPTPSLAFQKAIEFFLSPAFSGFTGIHPTAVVHPEAKLAADVVIGPHAVIDRKACIGARTVIDSGVYVGPETIIGEDCHFHPNVVVREGCQIGNRVILQPGAIIGSCGYGYFTDKKGRHSPLKQLGNVILEDDVEIGANTTIDRARFKTTRIGRGTKIDNLVQIAHQVSIGEDNLIVSQTGIAGSSKTGRNVVLAGQVGIIGHVNIADGVIMAARSAAIKSIEESGVYSGAPAAPVKEYNEQMVYLRNIRKLADKLNSLERKLQDLERKENE